MKVAIVHDWLTGMRGGEKCLEVFCELFPEARLFTLLHDKGSVSGTIEKMDITTSFLQKIPGISRNYRNFLPFFPAAVRSFDLSSYDLVLSSSHCVAKGARIPAGALHICYCYTPMRYAWKFFNEYFDREASVKKWAIAKVIGALKSWDLATNKRVDYFIAISDNVKKRVERFYERDAEVIYPPVDTDEKGAVAEKGGYYLIVSALVPYKRVDLAVRSFNETGRKLVIIGTGTDLERLKRSSNGNIEYAGWADDAALKRYYAGCRALVFPGEEDFGIVPVEAQAYGKPVIAYAGGGALETVVPLGVEGHTGKQEHATGVFFHEQTASSLNGAIETFERNERFFDPARIRQNALRFNRDRFKREVREYIEKKWKEHLKDEEKK